MAARERILRGLRAVLLADGVSLVSRGVVILLLTRFLLDPSEYGLLFLAMSILGVSMLFSTLGLAKSAARFVTEYRESDPTQIRHIVRTTLGYNVVTIAVVCTVIVAFEGFIVDVIGEQALTGLLALGAGYVAARSLVTFTVLLFQGFNRVTWSAAIRAVESLTLPLLVVVFVMAGLGAWGALLGYVVSAALAALVGLAVLYRKFYADREPCEEPEPGLARRILEYSVPLTATRGANVLDKRIDIILVGYFLNPVAVGFYTLGKQVTEFIMAPANALGFAVSPTYGEQKASDELDRAASLYQQTLEHTLLLYVPAAAGIILVADPSIVLVFGADYAGAIPVVQVLSGFVVLQAITNITSDGLDYLGRARARAIAKGGTSAANFVLNLVLIPAMGVVGAAVATVLTHTVYVLVNVYIVHSELSLALDRLARTVGLVCLITALMSAVVMASMQFVSGIPTLVAAVLAGVVVWAGMSVVIGLVDPDDVRRLVTEG